MATYGAEYPVVAPISAETEGAAPTYGTGIKIGDLISTQITVNNNEASLYGDNSLSEYINKFRDADVSLNTTRLPVEAYSMLFGTTVDSTGGEGAVAGTIHFSANDVSPYVGFGFVKKDMESNVDKWWLVWISKVKFATIGEDVETEGENVVWKTPSLTGKGTQGGDGEWRVLIPYTSRTAAIAALKAKAGIE